MKNYPHLNVSAQVQKMSFDEARTWFHTVITAEHGGPLDFDQNLVVVMRHLTAYAIRDRPYCDQHGIALEKGIMLVGPTGVGKNTVMGWLRLFERCLHGAAWREAEATDIDKQCRSEQSLSPLDAFDTGAWCIHDAAYVETTPVNIFGNLTYPIIDLIRSHYANNWSKHGNRLFITTNLPIPNPKLAPTIPTWEAVYGQNEPIWSRINEMCNIIYLPGPDRRKL